MRRSNNQSGNAFLFVLLAVVLFAALAFTFSRGAQQGMGNISKQEAKVAAQEILSYARQVEGAVNRVRQNGCSETQINFNNAVVGGYSNTSAPADGSCDVFETTGGRATSMEPPSIALDGANTAEAEYGEWRYTGRSLMVGHESANTDLVVLLSWVSLPVCIEINNLVGVDNPADAPLVEPSGFGNAKFVGDFTGAGSIDLTAGTPSDTDVGCFESDFRGGYHFVKLLLAR